MRKLIARYVIRRLWDLSVRVYDEEGYGTIAQRYNICSLITSSLGGHSGWMPEDVIEDYKQRVGQFME